MHSTSLEPSRQSRARSETRFLLLFQGLTLATAGGSATFSVTLRDEFGNTLLVSDSSGNVATRHRSSGDIYTDAIITTRSALAGAGGIAGASYISVTRAGVKPPSPNHPLPQLQNGPQYIIHRSSFAFFC